MVVLIAECVTPGLRGEIRRWLLELRAGVYVGRLTARVRDELWAHVESKRRDGAILMVFAARTEQGYSVRTAGDPSRCVVELDGLLLTAVASSAEDGPVDIDPPQGENPE